MMIRLHDQKRNENAQLHANLEFEKKLTLKKLKKEMKQREEDFMMTYQKLYISDDDENNDDDNNQDVKLALNMIKFSVIFLMYFSDANRVRYSNERILKEIRYHRIILIKIVREH